MPFGLYDVTVPAWLQTLGAVSGLIGKARDFCAETGVEPDEIVGARLAPDMLPFAYQVKSVSVHSLGALEGVRVGRFSPDRSPFPTTLDELSARIAETVAALEAVEPAEVDALAGGDMLFAVPGCEVPFAAEDFLLSFSMPNFYFHATTAYDILRWKGVPLEKRDFLGRLRIRA